MDVAKRKDLYSSGDMIVGNGPKGNFADTFCGSDELVNLVLDSMRRMKEKSNRFDGAWINSANSGATGSGLAAKISEQIKDNLSGRWSGIYSNTIHSAPPCGSEGIAQVFNSALHLNYSTENEDLSIIFDNESVYNITRSKLLKTEPSHTDFNQLFAKVVASSTADLRHNLTLGLDFNNLQNNLIYFPSLHFLSPSFYPYIPAFDRLRIAAVKKSFDDLDFPRTIAAEFHPFAFPDDYPDPESISPKNAVELCQRVFDPENFMRVYDFQASNERDRYLSAEIFRNGQLDPYASRGDPAAHKPPEESVPFHEGYPLTPLKQRSSLEIIFTLTSHQGLKKQNF